MFRLISARRALLVATIGLSAVPAACSTSSVSPTGAAPSGSGSAAASPAASASAAPPSDGAAAASGSANPSGEASLAPASQPASPPASGDPRDDEVCLAIVPRVNVEAALDDDIGDVVALGTDPAVSLTCTYSAADGGTLLVTASAGDAAAGFQASRELTTGYGQKPVAIDGLGDQAFYAISAGRWPEQVVFADGPVLVRLLNQTTATIGQPAFAALATTAAEAISPAP